MSEANPSTKLHTMASAIEARLRLIFPADLFEFSLMSSSATAKELDCVVRRKPFVGLAFTGIKPGNTQRQLKGSAQWVVFVICQNEAGAPARFTGDNLGIGLFGMIMAGATILHGWTIADVGAVSVIDQIETVRPEGWGDDSIAIAAIPLSIEFTSDVAPGSSFELTDFLRLSTVWALPAPADPLPAQTILPRGA